MAHKSTKNSADNGKDGNHTLVPTPSVASSKAASIPPSAAVNADEVHPSAPEIAFELEIGEVVLSGAGFDTDTISTDAAFVAAQVANVAATLRETNLVLSVVAKELENLFLIIRIASGVEK